MTDIDDPRPREDPIKKGSWGIAPYIFLLIMIAGLLMIFGIHDE